MVRGIVVFGKVVFETLAVRVGALEILEMVEA